MGQSLELESVRKTLELMEDCIIFDLFRRSQYKANQNTYAKGKLIPGFGGSLLDKLLVGREMVDAGAGRYNDLREIPFFPDKVKDIKVLAQGTQKKQLIAPVEINKNDEIKEMYLKALNSICEPGDDKEYGSSAVLDIHCLQDLSSRIHLGKFVAECKWKANREALLPLLEGKKWKEMEDRLRDRQVEKRIYKRVKEKGERYNIKPDFIGDFYISRVIPLTMSVEIEYLKERREVWGNVP